MEGAQGVQLRAREVARLLAVGEEVHESGAVVEPEDVAQPALWVDDPVSRRLRG